METSQPPTMIIFLSMFVLLRDFLESIKRGGDFYHPHWQVCLLGSAKL